MVRADGSILVLNLRTLLQGRTTSLRRVRDGVLHLQDDTSRYTLLWRSSPSSQVDPVVQQDEDSTTLRVQLQSTSLPLHLRIWVEDVDHFHKGADQEESYFGKSLADSFFLPLQTFVVVDVP